MWLESISLEGFMSWSMSRSVIFDDSPLIAIVGDNGAGKSSLLESVLWALYGWSRHSDVDGVISTDRNEATVSVTCISRGQRLRVTRSRQRGKRTRLTLEVEGPEKFEDHSGASIAATEQAIIDLVGMNANQMATTLFAIQGDVGRFSAGMRPAERRALLEGLVGTDRFRALGNRAAEVAKRLEAASRFAEGKRIGLIAQGESLPALRERAMELKSAAQRLVEKKARAQAELEAARSAYEEAQRRLAEHRHSQKATQDARELATQELRQVRHEETEVKNQLEQARTDVSREHAAVQNLQKRLSSVPTVTQLQDAITELEARLEQLKVQQNSETLNKERQEAEVRHATAEIERLQAAHKTLRAKRAGLRQSGERCFTCGQPLSDDARHQVEASLAAEADSLDAQITDAQARLAKSNDAISMSVKSFQKLKGEIVDVEAKRSKMQRALTARVEMEQDVTARREHLASLRSVMAARQDALALVQQKVARLEQQLSALPEADDKTDARLQNELATLAQRLDAANAKAKEIDDKTLQLMSEAKAAEAEVARIEASIEQAKEMEAEVHACEHRASLAHTLAQICRQDIPQMLLGEIVEELGQRANDILQQLTHNQLSMEITLSRPRRTDDELVDTVEVVVHEGGHVRPYASFSGGEKFRIDLATRLGLAEVLGGGIPLEERTFVVDEGWGSLDRDGIDAVLGTIRDLSERVGRVLTITHTADVAERFPVRLVIARDFEHEASMVAEVVL